MDNAFHKLRVAKVVHETPDSVSLVLEAPPELRDVFAFRSGQH